MQLTEHFSLEELTRSDTAARIGNPNQPGPQELENLKRLAATLEQVRALLGNRPLFISSGFRSLPVNRAVGGSDTSAHVSGLAADFTCPAFGGPLAICQAIAASPIEYDQLIREFDNGAGGWVHIGLSNAAPRRMALTIDGNGTRHGFA